MILFSAISTCNAFSAHGCEIRCHKFARNFYTESDFRWCCREFQNDRRRHFFSSLNWALVYLDAGIAVISEARVVIGFKAEIRILFNGVVDDFDIIHRELAVIHSNAMGGGRQWRYCFQSNIVAIVHIQTFAVVVIGGVVGEGYAKVIAACHGGDAVACATVCLMAVQARWLLSATKSF